VIVVVCALAPSGLAAAGTDEPDERLVTKADVPLGLKLETSSTGDRTVIGVPALDADCRSGDTLFPGVEEAAVSSVEFLDEQRRARLVENCSAVVRLGTTIVDVRLFDDRGLALKACTKLVRTAVARAGS
jgi:hypothetical protein